MDILNNDHNEHNNNSIDLNNNNNSFRKTLVSNNTTTTPNSSSDNKNKSIQNNNNIIINNNNNNNKTLLNQFVPQKGFVNNDNKNHLSNHNNNNNRINNNNNSNSNIFTMLKCDKAIENKTLSNNLKHVDKSNNIIGNNHNIPITTSNNNLKNNLNNNFIKPLLSSTPAFCSNNHHNINHNNVNPHNNHLFNTNNTNNNIFLNGGEICGVTGALKEKNLRDLMERTGYPIEQLQGKGQRIYGPPPIGHPLRSKRGSKKGCEVFVGRLPRDCFEDELVPLMERVGPVYEMRMMMEYSGRNRGFCFVCYSDATSARRAVKELNDVEIRPSRRIGVVQSVDNCRIFLGGLPRDKKKEDVVEVVSKLVENVEDVILRADRVDKSKNRGFAFVEFTTHNNAAIARKKLLDKGLKLWDHTIAVDWAEPEPEVDPEIMKKVKVLYMHNLMLQTSEETIAKLCAEVLGRLDGVEKVKKTEDYAFVHFQEREDAAKCMEALKGQNVDGSNIEIAWSKPPKKDENNNNNINNNNSSQMVPTKALYLNPGGYLTTGAILLPQTCPSAKESSKKSSKEAGRGRVRGAGGLGRIYSRSPSVKRGAMQEFKNIAPFSEVALPNHLFYKAPVLKPATQALLEYCINRGWSMPEYKMSDISGVEDNKETVQHIAEAVIPIFPNLSFQPSPLCRSGEEAIHFAAFNAYKQLNDANPMPLTFFQPPHLFQNTHLFPPGGQFMLPPPVPHQFIQSNQPLFFAPSPPTPFNHHHQQQPQQQQNNANMCNNITVNNNNSNSGNSNGATTPQPQQAPTPVLFNGQTYLGYTQMDVSGNCEYQTQMEVQQGDNNYHNNNHNGGSHNYHNNNANNLYACNFILPLQPMPFTVPFM